MVQEERPTLLQTAQRQSYFMTGKYETNSGWDETKVKAYSGTLTRPNSPRDKASLCELRRDRAS